MKEGTYQKYTKETFSEEFGVDPDLWIDVLALQGDSVDNIPGVHTIGHKRALHLVSSYGKIENIFERASEVFLLLGDVFLLHLWLPR